MNEEPDSYEQIRAQIEREEAVIKFRKVSRHFCRSIAAIAVDGRAMIKLKDRYPDLHFLITDDVRRALTWALPVINEMAAKFNLYGDD